MTYQAPLVSHNTDRLGRDTSSITRTVGQVRYAETPVLKGPVSHEPCVLYRVFRVSAAGGHELVKQANHRSMIIDCGSGRMHQTSLNSVFTANGDWTAIENPDSRSGRREFLYEFRIEAGNRVHAMLGGARGSAHRPLVALVSDRIQQPRICCASCKTIAATPYTPTPPAGQKIHGELLTPYVYIASGLNEVFCKKCCKRLGRMHDGGLIGDAGAICSTYRGSLVIGSKSSPL